MPYSLLLQVLYCFYCNCWKQEKEKNHANRKKRRKLAAASKYANFLLQGIATKTKTEQFDFQLSGNQKETSEAMPSFNYGKFQTLAHKATK